MDMANILFDPTRNTNSTKHTLEKTKKNMLTIKPPIFKSRNKPAVESRRGAVERGAAPPRKAETKPAEDIDESAEAFIRRFRQQLLQQWMESMDKNYDQMIKRGVY